MDNVLHTARRETIHKPILKAGTNESSIRVISSTSRVLTLPQITRKAGLGLEWLAELVDL